MCHLDINFLFYINFRSSNKLFFRNEYMWSAGLLIFSHQYYKSLSWAMHINLWDAKSNFSNGNDNVFRERRDYKTQADVHRTPSSHHAHPPPQLASHHRECLGCLPKCFENPFMTRQASDKDQGLLHVPNPLTYRELRSSLDCNASVDVNVKCLLSTVVRTSHIAILFLRRWLFFFPSRNLPLEIVASTVGRAGDKHKTHTQDPSTTSLLETPSPNPFIESLHQVLLANTSRNFLYYSRIGYRPMKSYCEVTR